MHKAPNSHPSPKSNPLTTRRALRQAYNGGRVAGLSLRLDVDDVVVVTILSPLPTLFDFLLLVLAGVVDANVLPRGQHLLHVQQASKVNGSRRHNTCCMFNKLPRLIEVEIVLFLPLSSKAVKRYQFQVVA